MSTYHFERLKNATKDAVKIANEIDTISRLVCLDREEIMKEESGCVIGLEKGENFSGTKITLGVIEDDQWIKGKVDANGWFTIKHKETGKFMTSKDNEDHPTIEGKLGLILYMNRGE